MRNESNFTQGGIVAPLLRFAVPVLLALFLQAMYGAVDLLVIGRFCAASDVSAVSTGSSVMLTITYAVVSFAMGATVLLGQAIGRGDREKAGKVVGTSAALFAAIALGIVVLVVPFAPALSRLMQAPTEAFDETVRYVRICAAGAVFIVAFNLLGSVFRGIGDSRLPLFAVAVACAFNIAGDLLLVAVFDMGVAGAALATVLAQALSVVISFLVIRRRALPFAFTRRMIRLNAGIAGEITRIGLPVALQDVLVSVSFLVIIAIVNALGVVPSAGVGVAEKICAFVMLAPSAFMQSMSAFVAQNIGANKVERANRALRCGILCSLATGLLLSYLSFFHGDIFCAWFSSDPAVALAGWEYLKAYAIDCLLTSFLFCFIGYFNGCGRTTFVMAQGILGAFGVRIPVAYLMSKRLPISLFHVGLATPASSTLQILLCVAYFFYLRKKTDGKMTAI